MSLSCKLSPEDRQLVRDIVAGLEGAERHRESARVRSKVVRMNPEYRAADNARQAAHEREKYYANLDESRRKAAEKWRSRRAMTDHRLTHGRLSADSTKNRMFVAVK